jgi:hypothetical protein
MPAPQFSHRDLNLLQQQLSAWRRRQVGRRRIPPEVWAAAAALARVHGAATVGRVLRLDFYKLRQRLRPTRAASPLPTFVEVGWPKASPLPVSTASTAACTVELSDATSRRLRMEFCADTPTLVALAQAFWRQEA